MQSYIPKFTHTHTHTHAHAHAHIHTYTRAQAHAHSHAHALALTHACTPRSYSAYHKVIEQSQIWEGFCQKKEGNIEREK